MDNGGGESQSIKFRIFLSEVATRLANRAVERKSFLGINLISPVSWKIYEIETSKSIIRYLRSEGAKFDRAEFDYIVTGISGSKRQIDLALLADNPKHFIAVEFRRYTTGRVSMTAV